ncbi:MAG: sulfatase-like hydrolase/transferase [Bacteroidales bacterium]|nr:sulfatase-like hydrolase/transferase [Bacteroidales bacterium]
MELERCVKEKPKGQPFFIQYNTWMSHEDKIHSRKNLDEYYQKTLEAFGYSDSGNQPFVLKEFEPGSVPHPPYHPDIIEVDEDWANYYNCIERMDAEVGMIMAQLEEDSLLENTIIFYFSDHGGVVARSKRFIYETGLKVPFIIRFPHKFQYLADDKPGSRTDRIISFVDLPPTLLNILGIEIPEYMQGEPFLGIGSEKAREFAFGFRGRMDEVYDFSVTVRDKKFRYIKNYMNNRIYGQHIEFLWKAKLPAAWQKAYKEGKCNELQSAFWQTKPIEELYEISNDPYNTINLAENPGYKEDLVRMQKACDNWLIETKDKSFIPEGEMIARSKGTTPYHFVNSPDFPFDVVKETAEMALQAVPINLPELMVRLKHKENTIRYWAAIGCSLLKEKASPAKVDLLKLLDDSSPDVAIAAAEALYYLNEKQSAIEKLQAVIESKPEEGMDEIMFYQQLHALNVMAQFDDLVCKDLLFLKEYSENADIPDLNRKIVRHLLICKN